MLHPDLVEVIEAVKNRPARITLEQLAENANVTLRWLQEFIGGKINEPTYTRVARVRDCVAKYNRKD